MSADPAIDARQAGRGSEAVAAAEKPRVYGVSELTDVIRGLFRPYSKIYVEGEISGWKIYASGHAYFTLKDEGAQLACVMFASSLDRCKAKDALADGAKVVLYGRLDVYAPRGSYQMVVLAAKIAGVGDLMAQFNALKEKLGKEGLFDADRKRPLPFLPHRIAIVTSPSGAVIHDMCTVLTRRFPNVEIRLYPVKVQGPGAAEEIVEGIRHFGVARDWQPDVLIIGRGGGSLEDLWAFNEECVVRAVAAATVPTVSAVGHETDITLCDFAADVRAGTPSIAAEIVVPVKEELVQQVKALSERLCRAPEHAGEVFAQRIDHLALRLSTALDGAVTRTDARLAGLSQRLAPALKDAVARAETRLGDRHQRLLPLIQETVAALEKRLVAAQSKLGLLDPGSPLKRGYSLTLDASGGIVRRAEDVRPGDTIRTRLGEGEITSTVKG